MSFMPVAVQFYLSCHKQGETMGNAVLMRGAELTSTKRFELNNGTRCVSIHYYYDITFQYCWSVEVRKGKRHGREMF